MSMGTFDTEGESGGKEACARQPGVQAHPDISAELTSVLTCLAL